MRKVPLRRSDIEGKSVGDLNDGISRYYDHNLEATVVKIKTGDCYVTSDTGEMLVTILGSCISVCARDPVAGVGGMNHFLLPGNLNAATGGANFSTRFGAYAMEELINGLIKLGARKERLELKVFGGGNVIQSSQLVGTKNIVFVKDYCRKEGIAIAAEDVGGDYPRRVHYFPDSGKVKLRRLQRKEDMTIVNDEKKYEDSLTVAKPTTKASVDLF
jgi:chemotaxis protein CheD